MSESTKTKKPRGEMATRIVSAAVMIAITAVCMAVSRLTRLLFLTAVAVLSCKEMAQILRKYSLDVKQIKDADEPETPLFKTKWPLVACCVAGIGVLTYFRVSLYWRIAWFFLCLFAIFFAEIVSKNWFIPERGRNALANMFCLVYPGFPFFLILAFCDTPAWAEAFFLACASTMICDTFALCGGKRFGKRKLASLVSPHKTWEGALCGAASSILTGVLFWAFIRFVPIRGAYPMPLVPCIVTSLIASTFGQVGDLTASLFKRMAGLKDYSNLIPGHGGAMDRVDSLLFSIPVTYFLLTLFGVIS